MGSIVKLDENKFRIFYDLGKDPLTGKRRRPNEVFRGSHRQAKARLVELEAARNAGTLAIPCEELTLGDWYRQYLEIIKAQGDHSPNTLRFYRNMWQRTDVVFGNVPLTKIEPRQVVKFLDELQQGNYLDDEEKTLSTSTVIRHYNFLHHLLQEAIYREYLRENPVDAVRPPRATRHQVDPLTMAEINELLKKLQHEPLSTRLFLSLALYTGLRRGELLGLTWRDISRVDNDGESMGLIRVERTAIRVDGEQQVKYTKTPGSVRTAGISNELLGTLEEWKQLFKTPPRDEDYIFSWPDTGKWWHLDYPSKAVPKFMTAQKMRRIRLHDARHTFVSLLLASGMDIKQVQTLAGHSQAKTTLDIYGHLISDPAAAAPGLISSLLAHDLAQSRAKTPNNE